MVALLAGLLVALGAAPAQAGAGYRYWSFWEHGSGAKSWTYATQGPSVARPGDGETIGFRFAVSEDSANAVQPRGTADFGTICVGTPAKGGDKRVAVVIDFGTAADASGGDTPKKTRTHCAQVDEGATAGEALAAVAKPLRYNSAALLCAIAGYPSSGCGEKTGKNGAEPDTGAAGDGDGDGADKSAGRSDDGGPSAGLIGGIATVVVLGAAAVWQARRRRV
ncbi:SCO2322 family protein [Streptomyces cucumeris]|uniref:SCO2322 family protein n=1 Tax=Streptomyces cucumeris TaxID=2962890 RepID=UPI003EBA7850